MLTYEYKLYDSKRNRKLDAMLREACFVWNHALALQKRYYSLTGKYCSCARMKTHFAKRIARCRLHSQTVQEILERLDASYKRFFNHLAARPPKCEKGSSHRRAARLNLDRIHEVITHRRDEWQWKISHELCRAYDTLCIEDLQLTGMSRLWGRKMSDLAFGSFVQKLEHTASKYGCKVVTIDRYYPSSKTCNVCQYVNELLTLNDRSWTCPSCGTHHDRDVNAAINILRQGIASSGSTRKTELARQGASATGESPLL